MLGSCFVVPEQDAKIVQEGVADPRATESCRGGWADRLWLCVLFFLAPPRRLPPPLFEAVRSS
jgi:hypothetical protein